MRNKGMVGVSGLVLLVGGCATTSGGPTPEQIGAVELLSGRPTCEYESLGQVSGGDGHEGVATGMIWGPRGSDERALQELKANAAALGADAVIIVQRRGGQREKPRGALSVRPARRVEFIGTAIRNCEPETKTVVIDVIDAEGNSIKDRQ